MTDTAASLPVLCLAGPTGAGKTALALRLADSLNGEVVNCDSRQLYRDFPVITAQPSAEEQAHCPHHLYGWLETEKAMDVATWIGLAKEKILEVRARNHVPLLVGGTGMYFQHLLRGIAQVPLLIRNCTRSCCCASKALVLRHCTKNWAGQTPILPPGFTQMTDSASSAGWKWHWARNTA